VLRRARVVGLSGAAAILVAASTATTSDGDMPMLNLPVACSMGQDCFVQQYPDRDPGPLEEDYRCGRRTYDGHDGTDIRVASLARARSGVPVLAAASGIVRGVRDGVRDSGFAPADRTAIAGRECGNGVVLAHAGGWETQYCHMAVGSIAVRRGDKVAAGTPLGRVGMSGDAQFPHLHFSVRQGPRQVDPFAPDSTAQCGSSTRSLWTPAAAASLAYHRTEVINSGFATEPVEMIAVEAQTLEAPNRRAPALIAWVRAIGLQKGDLLSLRLVGPDGAVIAESAGAPLDRDKAQWLMFAGRKRRGETWPAGEYVAVFTVTAGGKSVLSRRFSLALQ
jgi:hypothetical protein